MSWDRDELPDDKNTKVFRHARMEPEEPKHQSPRDRKKCKRNKGGPHDMVLVKDEEKVRYEYRRVHLTDCDIWERRPFRWFDREWRCSHCDKKEVPNWRTEVKDFIGDWEEHRRWEVKRK